MNNKYDNKISAISEIALMLSLTLVLEFISRILSMAFFPAGGSFNLGLTVIFLFSFRRGMWQSLILTTLNGILLVLIYNSLILGFFQFFLDYLLGFWAYSIIVAIVGFTLKTQKITLLKMFLATTIGIMIAFLCSTLSGYLYFFPTGDVGSRWLSSAIYNIAYTIPTLVITWITMIALMRNHVIVNW